MDFVSFTSGTLPFPFISTPPLTAVPGNEKLDSIGFDEFSLFFSSGASPVTSPERSLPFFFISSLPCFGDAKPAEPFPKTLNDWDFFFFSFFGLSSVEESLSEEEDEDELLELSRLPSEAFPLGSSTSTF